MPRLPVVTGSVPVPEGVTVEIKSRTVVVTGPRGKDTRAVRPRLDLCGAGERFLTLLASLGSHSVAPRAGSHLQYLISRSFCALIWRDSSSVA